MMDMDMSDMATSTMSMATSTMSGMMSTSTGMDMDMGSGSSSSMSMSMSDMAMTFFTSFKTPLYGDGWTPSSQGHYAGTCIFLIVLAVILRIMIAVRPILEGRLWTDGIKHSMDDHVLGEEPQKQVSGVRQSLQEMGRRWSRWRVNPAAGRATYELLLAGIAYLLMLAIMTMNVGYFMSVLGGIWLGTFIMGSVAAESSWMHC